MKKNVLHTINRWNKLAVIPKLDENLFLTGSEMEKIPRGTARGNGMAGLLSGQLSNSVSSIAPLSDNLNTLYKGFLGAGNYGSASLKGTSASGVVSPTANPLTSGYHITPKTYTEEGSQAGTKSPFVATEPTIETPSESPFNLSTLKSLATPEVTKLATDLAGKYIFKTAGESAAKGALQQGIQTGIKTGATAAAASAAAKGLTAAAPAIYDAGYMGSMFMSNGQNLLNTAGATATKEVGKSAVQGAAKGAVSGTAEAVTGAAAGAGKFGSALGASSLSSGAAAGIGLAGSLVGQGAKYLISDGYSTGAGNAIADIGGLAGGVVGYFNPIIGAIVSAATGIIGGAVNRAFSIKTDEEALANNEVANRYYTSYKGDVKSLDDIPSLTALTYKEPYKSGWFKSADKKNENAKRQFMNSRNYAQRGVENDIYNIMRNKLSSQYANSYDEGGAVETVGQDSIQGLDSFNTELDNYELSDHFLLKPLLRKRMNRMKVNDSNRFGNGLNNVLSAQLGNALTNFAAYGGALGLMQQNRYFDTINNRTAALSKNNNNQLPLYAFGGELGTNGTDWTNGLLHIDEGGSHESNPFDGVPMGFDSEGVPNLVEEGETIYNNYVFSDRMIVPDFMLKDLGLPKGKKDISFADASKRLAKESEQRPNDPISLAGLEASLSKLAEIQETERMKKQAKEFIGLMEFCNGGKMGHKFDDGGVKPYAYSKSWDGFKYFDPKTGKYDKGYLDFVNNISQDWLDRIFSEGQPYGSMDRYLAKNKGYALTPQQASALAQDKKYSDMHKAMAAAYDDYMAGMDPKTGQVIDKSVLPDESWEFDPYGKVLEEKPAVAVVPEEAVIDVGDMTGEQEYNPKGAADPKKYATWMRYAPVIGAGALSLTDALGLTNKPDYTGVEGLEAAARAAGYVPEVKSEPIGDYMRYTPFDRQYYINQLMASSRATDRALGNTSSPSKAASILANGYNTTLSMGNMARQAEEYNRGQYERVKEFNRKTNMFNSQMGLEAAMANARYSQQAKQYSLSGLAQAAALRDSIDQRVGAARAANLSNFLTSLGNIGRENFTFNQINSDRSRRYKVKRSGQSYYDNDEFGLGGRIKKCR